MDEIDRLIESAAPEAEKPEAWISLAVHQHAVHNWIEDARESARDAEIMTLRCYRVMDIAGEWRHLFRVCCWTIGFLVAVIVGLAVVLAGAVRI